MIKLYSYYRSSAAYRVRIALNLKGLEWETVPINLLEGTHKDAAYRTVNPQGRVPTLVTDEGSFIQSPAILEYIEQRYPSPPLLPEDRIGRARVREICHLIACDIHPLNNLSTLGYLKKEFGADQEQIDTWYAHWITTNFTVLESMLQGKSEGFCYGASPTLADCYLIPQIYNARRFNVPLDKFPTLVSIEQQCLTLAAFDKASPEQQRDCQDI